MSTILLLIAVLVIAVTLWKINRRPVHHSQAEVAAMLQSLLKGTTGSREWDYFMAVRIADPRLESIRARCAMLWQRGSPSLRPGAPGPNALSALGKDQVAELLAECESLKRASKPSEGV